MSVTYASEIAAAYPTSALTTGVLLTKLRTDYPEFTVTNFIQANSINGIQYTCTPRFNATNSVASQSGTSRVYEANWVQICPRVLQSFTAGTAASLSPTTVAWAAAAVTNAGNWVSDGTVNGLPLVHHTTTVTTEHVIYTVVVPAGGRIAAVQPANTTNGGLVDVKVSLAGVEIASSNYSCALVGGVRQFDLSLATAAVEIEIAYGLDAGTYTVDFTLDAATGVTSNRLYSCQVITTNPLAWNTQGETGYWATTPPVNVGGNSNVNTCDWWASVSYQVTNATRVTARVWQTSNCGQVVYHIFDSNGNLLNSLFVDGFGPGVLTEFELITNAAKGTYYVVMQGLGTKNASSTNYKFADGGCYGYDQTTVGVIGTDPPSVVTNGLFSGTGNMEHAIESRRVGSPNSQIQACSGTHGSEIQGTPTFTLDGNVIDYAGGAAGATWNGTQLVISWTASTVGFVQIGAAITQSAGLATVVMANHGYSNGTTVNVSAAFPVAYNGDKVITVVDANTFTYAVAGGTASPATGTIYIFEPSNSWCSFTLTQTFDATGYEFVESFTTTENCYLGFFYGPMLMGPAAAAPVGFKGADSGVRWAFADGSAPVILTGQTDTPALIPIAASLATTTGNNQFIMTQQVLSPAPTSCRYQNRSDGYGKLYTTLHEGNNDPTGGDLIASGTTFNVHGKFRVVANNLPVRFSGPRTTAGTRTIAGARQTAGTRIAAGTRSLVY